MLNNLKATSIHAASPGPQNSTGPFPHSAHQVFVEHVFQDNGPFPGVFGQIFRIFTKTLVTHEDFNVEFHFAKGEWHIKVKPKSSVGAFAIKQLKESNIKSELSGKESV